MQPSLKPDDLLRHGRRLRELARGLVRCEHEADDVVQDAFLRAVEQPPRHASKLGNWLSVVVRNRARKRGIERTRRAHRERAVAQSDAIDDDTASRFALCRRIVEAVDSLEARYRTPIVLRFFEDLPPREIAARLDLPVNTVRTRIARALDQLRARLDREHDGGRSEWIAVLAPLTTKHLARAGSASTATIGAGVAIVNTTKFWLAAAVVLLLGLGLIIADPWSWRSNAASPVAGAATTEHRTAPYRAPTNDGAGETVVDADPSERTEVGAAAWRVDAIAVLSSGAVAIGVPLRARLHDGRDPSGPAVSEASLRTGTDGRSSWAGPAPGRTTTLVFESDDPRWHCAPNARILVGGAPPARPIRLDVTQLDTELRGFVRDERGASIAGAIVRCGNRFETRTGEDGGYATRASSRRGRTSLQVQADGYAYRSITVPIPRPNAVVEQDVTLIAGFRVHGIVRNSEGEPVEGVEIRHFHAFEFPVYTRSDGSYELTNVARSLTEAHVFTRHPGYLDASEVVTVDGADARADLVLERGLRAGGVVVAPDGSGVEGAKVHWRPEALNNDEPNAITDEHGRFELTGGEPYWRRITVTAPGYALRAEPLPDEPARQHLRIVMQPGRSVGGIVTDRAGRPLPGVAVFGSLGNADDLDGSLGIVARSDAIGRFEMHDLPIEPVTLGFVRRGYLRAELREVSGTREDLSVELTAVAGIAGTVLDGRTGEAVPSFRVRFVRLDPTPGERRIESYWAAWTNGLRFDDADGHWSTRDEEELEPDTFIGIQVLADGFAPSAVVKARAVDDARYEDIVVRLWPGGVVTGRVVHASTERPIGGARVYLFGAADEPRGLYGDAPRRGIPQVETGADGRFRFDDVASGSTHLVIRHEHLQPAVDGPFEGPAGDAAIERIVRLGVGATLIGHVIDARGLPLSEARVQLAPDFHPDGRHRTFDTTTDAEGRFRFERMQPGPHTLSLAEPTATGHRFPLQRRIELRDGELESDLDAYEGDASIAGRLSEGVEVVVLQPLLSADDRTPREGALVRMCFVDGDRYAFAGLAEGAYEVRVSTAGGRRAEIVTVGATEAARRDF